MVGLKLILQDTRMNKASAKIPQILSKTTMLKPPPPPTTTSFLQSCFLCKRHLSQGEDIYMYRGDEAFCSEECRWKQMLMDEEESMRAFLERERKLMVSYNK